MGDDRRDVITFSAPAKGDSRPFMDIACPTCATTYEIDEASVGEAGRKVRCAGCGTVWRTYRDRPSEVISAPPPPEPEPVIEVAEPPPLAPEAEDIQREPGETPAEAVSEAEPAPEPAAPPARAKIVNGKARSTSTGGGARKLFSRPVLLTAAALALIVGGVALREQVVRFVPQSAAVFAAVGLPVNLRGIEIRDVKSRMVEDNGVSVLVIDGNLVSVAKQPAPVPRLRFAVIGDRGQEVYVWSAQADRPDIKPGETMGFRRRLAAPPSDGREVSVRFLTASDMTAGLK